MSLYFGASFPTPLGEMFAVSDNESLVLLEFADCEGLEWELKRLNGKIVAGGSLPLESIQRELQKYFNNALDAFNTPVKFFGTAFQKRVWDELRNIPFGKTSSYGDLARNIGNPKGFRAVAQACNANQLAIIIPCHRVIQSNGELGGYAGRFFRKEKLLDLEKGAIYA